MAVSGTNTYTITRNDLIDSALRTLGVIGLGETPQNEDYTNCSQALNIMIKSWAKKGLPLWTFEEAQIPMVANTKTYSVKTAASVNRPVRVIDAWLNDEDFKDTTLTILSRQEYDSLGNKLEQGTPNQVYFDVLTSDITMYVYPLPETGTTDTIYLKVQRMFYDMNSSTDNFDFPQEWFQALKWGLVAEIAVEYGIDIQLLPYYEQKANAYINEAFDFSVEEPSVYFTMDMRGG